MPTRLADYKTKNKDEMKPAFVGLSDAEEKYAFAYILTKRHHMTCHLTLWCQHTLIWNKRNERGRRKIERGGLLTLFDISYQCIVVKE